MGYFFLVSALASPMLLFSGTFILPLAIFLGGVACIFSLYSSVVWLMAFVISVIEENCHGIKALEKAEELVKGQKLHGFILNLGFSLLSLTLFQGFRSIIGEKWLNNHMTVFWLLVLNWSCLQMMFQLVMTCTVLHFHCKKYHGEELEMHGTFGYSKVSTVPQFVDILPQS